MNSALEKLMFEELANACRTGGIGGFLPAVRQVGNVAALPAIVNVSLTVFFSCLSFESKQNNFAFCWQNVWYMSNGTFEIRRFFLLFFFLSLNIVL